MSERLKNIYKKISEDKNLHKIYEKVDKCNNNMWALHGMQHIINVDKMVENILSQLCCDEDLIYKAKICAYLHDIGAVSGKDGHAQKSAEFCKDYLSNFDLYQSEKEEIIFAILNHSHYIHEGGLILASLVFSDKLDTDKTRLSESGYRIEGLREIQWINKISVDITDKLIVAFSCDENFNQKAFEEYYFCKKIFDSIKSFAKVIGKDYKVLINNKEWNY